MNSYLEFVLPDVSSFAKYLGKFMGESRDGPKSWFCHIFVEIDDFSKFFKIGTGGRFHTINVADLVYRKSVCSRMGIFDNSVKLEGWWLDVNLASHQKGF